MGFFAQTPASCGISNQSTEVDAITTLGALAKPAYACARATRAYASRSYGRGR